MKMRAHFYNFHNILKIKSLIDLNIPSFEVNDHGLNVDVEVEISDRPIQLNGMIKLGNNFFGRDDEDCVYYLGSLYGRKFYLSLENLLSKTKICFNKNYLRLIKLPLTYVLPAAIIVWRVCWIKLLLNNFTFVHGACIGMGDDAFMLKGFSNTGKTYTTLSLIQKYPEMKYFSDDATILGRGSVVYSNYTRLDPSLLKSLGFKAPAKKVILNRINRVISFPIPLFLNIDSGVKIEDVLDSSRIGATAKLKAIIFLERGSDAVEEMDVEKHEAYIARKILAETWNGLAPHYSSVPIIQVYSYLNRNLDLYKLMNVELDVISDAVKSSRVFRVRSKDGRFIDPVYKIISST